jgi:hypothetical protein
MTPRTVGELTDELVDTIRTHAFGLVAISGVLHGWKIFRSGIATGELVEHGTGARRLRIFALRHHAKSADEELSDIGWVDGDARPVTVHGHVVYDPRWGLQIQLLRLSVEHADHDLPDYSTRDRPNALLPWPTTIDAVGLVAPSGGDDARADVETVLAAAGIETIEFRVAVTGPRAPIVVAQALDRLALDPRPTATLLIRGGGPASDFVTFDDPLVGIAIDRHRHPVVTGLGHATNHTLADIAAHTSCITPTAAAHLVAAASEAQAPAASTTSCTDECSPRVI